MEQEKRLSTNFINPFIIKPGRSLPEEMAIVGAGSIGPDIGYYLINALPSKKLYLVDIAAEALKKAEERYKNKVQKAVEKKKLNEDQAQSILANVIYTTDYERIKNCDLVIEAATENLEMKRKIFEGLENIVKDETILTSNTSSIPADRIFSNMKKPDRCTVTHFFAPAWMNPGVEVVKWEKVSSDVLNYMYWFFAQTGKVPVITENVISFMFNRIFENLVNESGYLLDIATAAQICSVAEEFVFQGPLYVVNMGNGNPIITEANTRKMEEGEHYKPALIFRSVEKWNVPRPGTKVEIDPQLRSRVRDRLLGILFSQSFDIADRGIGLKEDLNLGTQIALGFRKGIFDIMRDLGESEVSRIVDAFSKERPGFPKPKKEIASYQKFNRWLQTDEIDGVKIITIRRPKALNALNDEITDEVLGILKADEDNPHVKGFVITGYGTKAFSAGADVGIFPSTLGDKQAAANLARHNSRLVLYMDQMTKPIVAAVNGMALGGGLEHAIRCHAIVATKNASFQLPEITLGILPGLGGAVAPYRKWPHAAALFHEMICLARKINAQEAAEIGMVVDVSNSYPEMIYAAVDQVRKLQGKIPRIPDGRVSIPEIRLPSKPMAGNLALSDEALSILTRTIKDGANAETFAEALEINCLGSGSIACTDAAKEGVAAFFEKRKPNFKR